MITVRCVEHVSGSIGLVFPVRVTPKGGKDCILPFSVGEDVIKLKVSVPPEAGKANAAVLKLLATALLVPKSSLQIISGEKSRYK